MKCICKWLFWI